MNTNQIGQLMDRILLCAITRDHADIWLLNEESTEPIMRISRIHEHQTHVKTAQDHHLHDTDIGEVPYFVNLARALTCGSHVLLLGHGDGKANYMNRFMNHVSAHHLELVKKVVAEENVNLPNMTSAQIVGEARRMWKSTTS